MALSDLPNSKWLEATRQVILLEDLAHIEEAILEIMGISKHPPTLAWVDAATVRVNATADCPAALTMGGYPNIINPGSFVSGGLSDGGYRANTSNVSAIIGTGGIYGSEKASQWYAVLALAGDADTTFTIKGIPFCRYSSEAAQVITLRNNLNAADIGYGFTTDEFVDGKIYILSGTSKGLMRTITANNNNDATGGTITYSGDALTMTQGDWFVIMPPGTNFRWIGSFFNNSISNIVQFKRLGNTVHWLNPDAVNIIGGDSTYEIIGLACPLAVEATLKFYEMADDYEAGLAEVTNAGALMELGCTQVFPLEFCKFRADGGPCYYISYRYIPGCGY